MYSIITVYALPFRMAFIPAVRYDLSGGLPTCLWYDSLYIRIIWLLVYLWNLCKADMVFVFFMLNKFFLSLSLSQTCVTRNVYLICLFVSLLSHFWLIHFFSPIPALSTISRPLSSSMCSITPETPNVGSSYNRMRGPGFGCWFSDRSNCSHWSLTLTFTLISENLS